MVTAKRTAVWSCRTWGEIAAHVRTAVVASASESATAESAATIIVAVAFYTTVIERTVAEVAVSGYCGAGAALALHIAERLSATVIATVETVSHSHSWLTASERSAV